jgi:hypothetical protein
LDGVFLVPADKKKHDADQCQSGRPPVLADGNDYLIVCDLIDD